MAEPLLLTDAHREAFVRLSSDRSPLHVDADHARRTPFGRVVLHGMAGVLAALGAWAKGRRFELLTIRGRFVKPVFTPMELMLTAKEESAVTLKLLKGNSSRLELKFTWRPNAARPEPVEGRPMLLTEAAIPEGDGPIHIPTLPYALNGDATAFHLAPDQLPLHQLTALAAASYLVGMVVPGRQALFGEFELAFEPAAPAPFALENIDAAFDPRFAQFRITGAGTGLKSIVLTAFRRPEPVTHSVAEVAAALQWKAQPFAGQTALVTGASRGFGAVLAQGLALGGAQVLLHHRAGRDEATQLRAELAAAGAQTSLVQADLTSDDDCRRLGDALRERPLDLVVHGAAGPISADGFYEQSAGEVLTQIQRALELDVRAIHSLLPAVKPGGKFLYISTAFTQAPEPKFAHYVAAKSAAEGLLRALAVELKGPQLLVARPPRMLTDQTNLPFQRGNLPSSVEVAKALLEALVAAPATPRYLELTSASPTAS